MFISIGNTSDNLEAVSEAASNHSVASSLELENEDQDQNDNLSDMVSANVSGRGTPNISGMSSLSDFLMVQNLVSPKVMGYVPVFSSIFMVPIQAVTLHLPK